MKKEPCSYSTSQIAEILGISRIAVHKRIKTGKLQAKKIGRNYAIPCSEVAHLTGGELTEANKKLIDQAIEKTVAEYGETLKMLSHS